MSIKQVKEEYASSLLAKNNVVGAGIGYKVVDGRRTNELSIVVSVIKKLPPMMLGEALIPRWLGGYQTDVRETGPFYALQEDRTTKHRPAPGGVSIGHYGITAGTLGCLVGKNGEVFILSNNHVLANGNLGKVGDPILQPGSYDGGTIEEDTLAELADFVPVQFLLPECPVAAGVGNLANLLAKCVKSHHRLDANQIGTNSVDAALAKPLSDDMVESRILEVGWPSGAAEVALGMEVLKSGRTTGVTKGVVTQVSATVQVVYGDNIAVFEDQVVANLECGGGDSGSAVLGVDRHDVVGLLFAGTSDGKTTIFSRIQNVMSLLGVDIV